MDTLDTVRDIWSRAPRPPFPLHGLWSRMPSLLWDGVWSLFLLWGGCGVLGQLSQEQALLLHVIGLRRLVSELALSVTPGRFSAAAPTVPFPRTPAPPTPYQTTPLGRRVGWERQTYLPSLRFAFSKKMVQDPHDNVFWCAVHLNSEVQTVLREDCSSCMQVLESNL